MPDQINGLPAHILLVHAVIVLIPLAALALVASAVWPLMRRKLGVLSPALALVALIFVPITTNAGEWLRDHLPNGAAQSPLVEKHTELGDSLLPWAIGIFVLSAAVWWVGRQYGLEWKQTARAEESTEEGSGGTAVATREQTRTTLPVWVAAAVAVVSIVVAGGAVFQLYRIGDSGSKAVWTGNFSQTETSHGGDDG